MTVRVPGAESVRAAVRTLRTDEKARKAVAAVVLLGLLAYAVAGVHGLAVLALGLALAWWADPLRQRFFRWYLLE